MAVRRDDRQVAHAVEEAPRHGAGGGVGGEEPILVKKHAGPRGLPANGGGSQPPLAAT